MRGVIPALLLGLAVLVVLEVKGDAPAPEEPQRPEDLARVAERLLAVPEAKRLLAACPADIQGTWQTRPGIFGHQDWTSEGTCARNLDRCAAACVENGAGDACTWVAFILEAEDDGFTQAARHGYAMACALGDPTGCTNRGANIRNAPRPFDPLSELPIAKTAACLARTFAGACAEGDAWGCAMSGQSHARGEGVPRDPAAARRLYREACALSGEKAGDDAVKAPCRFATGLLAELGATD
jgi:TPR repeat protein